MSPQILFTMADNVLKKWWNTGDIGTVNTAVEFENKTLVRLAIFLILTAAIIIAMVSISKKM
jgi:hypothetical protein